MSRDERRCVICDQPLVRRSGEQSQNFGKRKTCSKACLGILQSRIWAALYPATAAPRVCAICNAQLERRTNEHRAQFLKRKTCSKDCSNTLRSRFQRSRFPMEVGDHIGNLTVVEYLGKQERYPYPRMWRCAYDCGHAVKMTTALLLQTEKNPRSCAQCRNTLLEHDGRTQNLTRWAKELHRNYGLLYARIHRRGETLDQALAGGRRPRKSVEVSGVTLSQAEIARRLGISRERVRQKINKGWRPTAEQLGLEGVDDAHRDA